MEYEPLAEGTKCFHCGEVAKVRVFWGRSYWLIDENLIYEWFIFPLTNIKSHHYPLLLYNYGKERNSIKGVSQNKKNSQVPHANKKWNLASQFNSIDSGKKWWKIEIALFFEKIDNIKTQL